jgi:hypothetical protein
MLVLYQSPGAVARQGEGILFDIIYKTGYGHAAKTIKTIKGAP